MAAPQTSFSFRSATALRNKLVMVICALGLIAVAANIKLIFDVTSLKEGPEISTTVSSSLGAQPPDVRLAHLANSIRTRLCVLLGITVVCLGSMIYLFVSRVILPLHDIARVTEEMVKGNLSATAPSHHEGEIGELGKMINDLAVNFQEVLLLTGTAVGNSYAAVERIQQALEPDHESDGKDVKEQITVLKQDLEMLGAMVRDFQFYQTRFDGQKVVAQRSRTDG